MKMKLKVVVLCQNDVFVIPKNIKLLSEMNEIELCELTCEEINQLKRDYNKSCK